MDLARGVAGKPVTIPAMQVAPFSALEQQGLTAAGTTGVGQPTVTSGIGQLLACLLYTSPSPRDGLLSRMPSSA